MKPLYVTSVVTFSGKTALALGIGLKLREKGYNVGYLKPVSTQPFMIEGKLADEDSVFVKRVLGLDTPAWELSPVIIDEALFERLITSKQEHDYTREIKRAYEKASAGKDVLLLEGGASMREGYAIGLNTISFVEKFELPTLGVVRYRNGLMLIDDILALQFRLDKYVQGVVINSVPDDAMEQIKGEVVPYLERRGIQVFGVLPHQRQLMSMSVGEMIRTLDAKVLTRIDQSEKLVENLSVGAMSVESALPRFRRALNKAVITGGDRADIQAAALETSTTALILTGNLQPSSALVERAEELGVAVLLVPNSTMETVEMIEKDFGKTRLSQPEKLALYREILDKAFDWDRFMDKLGLK